MKHDIHVGGHYLVTVETYDRDISYLATYLAKVERIEGNIVTLVDTLGSGWESQDDLASMITDEDVHPVSSELATEIRGACLTYYLERMLHSREQPARELSL